MPSIEEVAAYAAFTGEWGTEDGVVQIKGTTLRGVDGSTVDLTIKNRTACAFRVGSALYEGHLSADGRALAWSDGAEWLRRGLSPDTTAEGPQQPPVLAGPKKPSLTLEQVLNMQKELYGAFSEQDFQDELEEVEAKHGKGYASLTRHHSELFLKVQNQILPQYGFDEGPRGVSQMFREVSRFNADTQFRRNRFMLNQLLGLLSPDEEAAEEDDDQDADVDAGPQDGIEVIVKHLIEDGVVLKVRVPADATFYDVRKAASVQARDPDILASGRLMKKQGGVFSAHPDPEPVGGVREVILLRGSASEPEAAVERQHEERLASARQATRLMLSLSCAAPARGTLPEAGRPPGRPLLKPRERAP